MVKVGIKMQSFSCVFFVVDIGVQSFILISLFFFLHCTGATGASIYFRTLCKKCKHVIRLPRSLAQMKSM